MLLRPTPSFNAVDPLGKPGPLSRISTVSMAPWRRARMEITPAPVRGEVPCWIAFSTMGCSNNAGTPASSASSETSGVDGEAVLEPGLLDLQVGGEELQLLAERDDLVARLLQRESQQMSQPRDQAVGVVGVIVRQLGDGVKSIEQEMRLQLHLEHLQLGAGQLGFELGGLHLALPVEQGISRRGGDGDDAEVGQETAVEPVEQPLHEGLER